MIIKTLVENTSVSTEYKSKHGISFYIETPKHKILFDLGQNDIFLKNAEKMGVDISAVDTVIISHGHFDHAGALGLFLEKNKTAKVYIRKNAFEKHYTKTMGLFINIGIDEKLKNHPQIILTDESTVLDNELSLFSGVSERKFYSQSNNALFAKSGEKKQLDDFSHEQSLIINFEGKYILVSGCSHAGIVNIMEKAEKIIGKAPDYVIAGFHLYNPSNKKYEKPELAKAIAEQLSTKSTMYYTCHCTGKKAYSILKDVLAEKIGYLSAGSSLEIKN